MNFSNRIYVTFRRNKIAWFNIGNSEVYTSMPLDDMITLSVDELFKVGI